MISGSKKMASNNHQLNMLQLYFQEIFKVFWPDTITNKEMRSESTKYGELNRTTGTKVESVDFLLDHITHAGAKDEN